VKRHRFHPEARIEARAATTWYRERSSAAALSFARAVADGVQSIREHPEAWPVWKHDVRRRVLRRMPYSIFYVMDGEVVVVVAVAHHKLRPGYWLPRLRQP
jgi:toxin ParE1/3/4